MQVGITAAKRFFKKMMRADHRRLPFSINTDKNAAYPDAFAASRHDKILPFDCKLRRVKYLNNVIEQDHRFVKKRVRAAQRARQSRFDKRAFNHPVACFFIPAH